MSLYRKYRPSTFEEVVGQEHVARTLRNALTAQPPRVAHAYLFTGPRGIGKTTNARLLAKCLNCAQGPTPTPCNQCEFCRAVTNNDATMDLLEIDAASNTQVDKVREIIIEKLGRRPTKADGYRIFIIDEVHMLSASSFNALLKTLEEPPSYVVFILATTEYQKVPATIASRCQRFDFRRVTPHDIVGRLNLVAKSEGMELHADAARLIARHAEGALRDALTLLEQVWAYSDGNITASDVRLVLGGVAQELIWTLVEAIGQHDARAVLDATELAVAEGASFVQLVRDLTSYARDLMLLTIGYPGDASLSESERTQYHQQAGLLGGPRLEALLNALREASREMRENVDHRLILELTLVRATHAEFGAPAAFPLPATLTAVLPVPSALKAPAPPARSLHPRLVAPSVAPVPSVGEVFPVAPAPPSALSTVSQEVAPVAQAANQEGVSSPGAEPMAAPGQDEVDASAQGKKGKGRRIASMDDLQELWPKLLMRIHKKAGGTVAYLHDARPAEFTGEEVVLEFEKEFHCAKAMEASKRMKFESIMNEVLDHPRRLTMRLAPRAVAAQPTAAPPPTGADDSNSDDPDDEPDDDIVEYTQRMFGADVMGRSS